nr:hypothetical protein [Pandoravirus massiliensis]
MCNSFELSSLSLFVCRLITRGVTKKGTKPVVVCRRALSIAPLTSQHPPSDAMATARAPCPFALPATKRGEKTETKASALYDRHAPRRLFFPSPQPANCQRRQKKVIQKSIYRPKSVYALLFCLLKIVGISGMRRMSVVGAFQADRTTVYRHHPDASWIFFMTFFAPFDSLLTLGTGSFPTAHAHANCPFFRIGTDSISTNQKRRCRSHFFLYQSYRI